MTEYDNDAELIDIASETKTTGFWRAICAQYRNAFSRRYYFARYENAPLGLRFRTTNQCNENCPHCFECSGPHNPSKYIAPQDIAYYINNAGSEFADIYITGGEWSLIYDRHPNYLSHIFQHVNLSQAKSNAWGIQTNARWTHGPHCQEILSDLKYIQDRLSTINTEMKLDTSVDRYHSDLAIDGTRKLIRQLATRPDFNNTKIRIMSCAKDRLMANNRILNPERLAKQNIELSFEPRSFYQPNFQRLWANHIKIVVHEEGTIMRIGRAKKNKFGYRIFEPDLQCGGLGGDTPQMDISFREDGTAKWHNYYDWDITTPYKLPDGTNKPLSQIRSELINAGWKKHIRFYTSEHAMVLLCPFVALPYAIWRNWQIRKTYRENNPVITYIAQDIEHMH
ncbi:MAG: hypothetical protein J6S06_01400 [Alphaproteobacteria bacterium]|nr:hypothetical protein [Alphaproteobacteria bacterium]